MKKRFAVAITGASGIIYGLDLLKKLSTFDCEIHCVITEDAKKILSYEFDNKASIIDVLKTLHLSKFWNTPQLQISPVQLEKIKLYDNSDFSAPIASGSFYFDAMAISPCSMKTLGKIANSIADTLSIRAAEVALKERRRLVIVARETPLALTVLRNMCTLTEAGAIILPPVPEFYSKPSCIGDLIDFTTARTLSAMGIEQKFLKEWGNENI